MALHPILLENLNAALATEPSSAFTPRDARLPAVPNKVHAVIGMRRTGKTTYLRQLLADRRRRMPAERALFFGFDDDRIENLALDQLGHLLEEYYRRFPELRGRETVHWFLDEIQLVDGWERFVRRAIDTEKMEIVVSGSSARMLSRELHTSLRGRAMATVIRPFGFREFLRHRKQEPTRSPDRWTSAERSRIENRFREYLAGGGFPEAQGLPPPLRVELLQGYVDTVLFRDVVERYGVSQVTALRWLVRHCLRNAAGAFSVHRQYLDLKAQGLGVAKDAVHAMLGHLIDSFLISTVPIDTESERQRNSNPRKVYPIDPGLIEAFDSSKRSNVGHALETVVLNELERRKASPSYVRTPGGFEVDFHARYPGGREELLQVCADLSDPETRARELRALSEAAVNHPHAVRRVLVLGQETFGSATTPNVIVQPAYEWLLAGAVEA